MLGNEGLFAMSVVGRFRIDDDVSKMMSTFGGTPPPTPGIVLDCAEAAPAVSVKAARKALSAAEIVERPFIETPVGGCKGCW
jgi:hypothetical protein